jgi:hypothetical protein
MMALTFPGLNNLPLRIWQRLAAKGEASAAYHAELLRELSATRMLTAHLLITQMHRGGPGGGIRPAEFKVFSQFGDDGVIQYLIHYADLRPENHAFVEFGASNYLESNTRFLLMNDCWRGLAMDGSTANVDFIRADEISWRYDLTAACAFIDTDNINELLKTNGFEGEIGLLSIDIDGNDYWVWQAIHVVRPIIVVVEYNSVFGSSHALSVPYDRHFYRTSAHWSNLYWGASLKGLYLLAQQKGYSFLGCNSIGNNAYFVRTDRLGALTPVGLEEGYVVSRFRDSRDREGRLTFLGGARRARVIEEMPLIDVERGVRVTLKDLEAGATAETGKAAA